MAALAMTLWHPGTAAAGTNYYCYANGNAVLLSPQNTSNDDCVSNGYNDLWQSRWKLTNGSGVNHCTTVKQYSDGHGSNLLDAGCGTAQYQYSACGILTVSPTYAKGTNESPSSSHYYNGAAAYGQCF